MITINMHGTTLCPSNQPATHHRACHSNEHHSASHQCSPSPSMLAPPLLGRPAGDIVRTELRLVLVHDGWEYCVLKRVLPVHAVQPDSGDMLVTAIEFEGRPEEAILGTLGFRVSLIAYPIIALRKVCVRKGAAWRRGADGSKWEQERGGMGQWRACRCMLLHSAGDCPQSRIC